MIVIAWGIPSVVGGIAVVIPGKGDVDLLPRHAGRHRNGEHIPIVSGEAGHLHAARRVIGISAVTIRKAHLGLPNKGSALLGHIDGRWVELYVVLQRCPIAGLVKQIHRVCPHRRRCAAAAFRPCVLPAPG